jgi:hydroxyacylglutathione hydrolase
MFFRQILHNDLGCASYLIADAGDAAVVDPKWETEEYLELADEHGFVIRYVLETHNHADHVSGRGRLQAATGAAIYTSPTPGLAYTHETLANGEAIEFGDVRIEALATPGHRPEHTAYLIFDLLRSDEPVAVLTGDSLFVGDIARPDLAVEAHEGARELYHSLQRLLELPDHVQVLPGHIGGSMCGGARMSETPASTIGFERRVNALLRLGDEDEFVDAMTSGLAAKPPNFESIVALNSGPLLTDAAVLRPLEPATVQRLLDDGATLIDARAPAAWAAAHVPGSLSITIVHATVGSRAAAVIDPTSRVLVTAAIDEVAGHVVRHLEAVGFRAPEGILAGGIDAWRAEDLPLVSTDAIGPEALAAALIAGDVDLLDVRGRDEWESGHVAGSVHIPVLELPRRLEEVSDRADGRALAVACAAGGRASLATSLLERAGVKPLLLVIGGGVPDLAGHGLELSRLHEIAHN